MSSIRSFLIDATGVKDPWIPEAEGFFGFPRRIAIDLHNAIRVIPMLLISWFVVLVLFRGSLDVLTEAYIQFPRVPLGIIFMVGLLQALIGHALLMEMLFPKPAAAAAAPAQQAPRR